MPLSVYDIVKGISQAVSNKHHGATDDIGKPIEIGLKREDEPIRDQKVMDGFGVSMHGNMLILRYHSVEPIRELHQKKFEKDVERRIADIKNYIVKEFSKYTNNSLRLKEVDEIKVMVETSNRMKAMVKAQQKYEILNFKDAVDAVQNDPVSPVEKLNTMTKYFKDLEKGKKRPQNEMIKGK